jgi:hypothetical protein
MQPPDFVVASGCYLLVCSIGPLQHLEVIVDLFVGLEVFFCCNAYQSEPLVLRETNGWCLDGSSSNRNCRTSAFMESLRCPIDLMYS